MDIADILREGIEKYDAAIADNKKITGMLKKLGAKALTYPDATRFSSETGRELGNVVSALLAGQGENLSEEDLKKLLSGLLRNNYDQVVEVIKDAQANINENAEVGLNPAIPDFDAERAEGIGKNLYGMDDVSDHLDNIRNLIENNSMSVVDEAIRLNAEAHDKAGLEAVVIRKYDGVGIHDRKEACKFCLSRAGRFTYQEANSRDVFRRHPGCGCEIAYITGKQVQRQTNWQTNTWTAMNDDGTIKTIEAYEEEKKPGNWREFKRKKVDEPDKDLSITNPGYATGNPEYTRNCQRCVSAYEMRRRGFDVVAKPLPDIKQQEKDDLSLYRELAWIDPDTGKPPERYWCMTGSGKRQVEKHMKQWGNGSRGIVGVNWKDGGAHVFIAENRDGKIVYIDPQSGDSDCSRYFKKAKMSNINRVDNCEPSQYIMDCCLNRRG